MPTAAENAPPYTEADYYGFFFNALSGLIDDAELSGYNEHGIARLREAHEIFASEFRIRHPEKW